MVVSNPRLPVQLGHRKQVMDEGGKLRYLPAEIVGEAKDIGVPIIDRPTWRSCKRY